MDWYGNYYNVTGELITAKSIQRGKYGKAMAVVTDEGIRIIPREMIYDWWEISERKIPKGDGP